MKNSANFEIEAQKISRKFDKIILVDKPAGISSFGVVAKIRYKLTEEKFAEMKNLARVFGKNPDEISRKSCKIKVGHAGTLDPFATGLLIILCGKFTKKSAEFLKKDKVYRAKIRLGASSSTGDPEGEIRENIFVENGEIFLKNVDKNSEKILGNSRKNFNENSEKFDENFAKKSNEKLEKNRENFARKIPQKNEIEKIIRENFLGEITQIPPIYSALKIDGKKAYEIARKNEKKSHKNREKKSQNSEKIFAEKSGNSCEKIEKNCENFGQENDEDFEEFKAKFAKEKARKITIFRLEILHYDFPNLEIRAHVSSGTYIRTLAEDIGNSLKIGGFCENLRREKIADFDVKNAQTLDEFLCGK